MVGRVARGLFLQTATAAGAAVLVEDETFATEALARARLGVEPRALSADALVRTDGGRHVRDAAAATRARRLCSIIFAVRARALAGRLAAVVCGDCLNVGLGGSA